MMHVPAYTTQTFSARRHAYCLCVFVLNEGERILAQLKKMQHLATQLDIIIADGSSNDGVLTPETLRAHKVHALLTKTGPGQLSAQMRMAFAYALAAGYHGIITIDGNNKDDPAAAGAFIQALENGADHIQGSRFISGGQHRHTPRIRLLAVRWLHAPMMRLASGFAYSDTTNGFRGYSTTFLQDTRVQPLRQCFTGYELHYYLAIRAARLGFTVCELPVTRVYPANGHVPTKIQGWRGNWRILSTLMRACLGRYNPP